MPNSSRDSLVAGRDDAGEESRGDAAKARRVPPSSRAGRSGARPRTSARPPATGATGSEARESPPFRRRGRSTGCPRRWGRPTRPGSRTGTVSRIAPRVPGMPPGPPTTRRTPPQEMRERKGIVGQHRVPLDERRDGHSPRCLWRKAVGVVVTAGLGALVVATIRTPFSPDHHTRWLLATAPGGGKEKVNAAADFQDRLKVAVSPVAAVGSTAGPLVRSPVESGTRHGPAVPARPSSQRHDPDESPWAVAPRAWFSRGLPGATWSAT